MDSEHMKKRAAEILSCQINDLEKINIQDQKVLYFRNTNRGGGAVIISNDNDILIADPFVVDLEEHLKKILNGERSYFE